MTTIRHSLLTEMNTDIAFTADDAVPGPRDVDWRAKDSKTFEASLAAFGGKLVAGIDSKRRYPHIAGARNESRSVL
jgi:hypothetical protein